MCRFNLKEKTNNYFNVNIKSGGIVKNKRILRKIINCHVIGTLMIIRHSATKKNQWNKIGSMETDLS